MSLSVLRIYPKLNDENNKWVSFPEGSRANYVGKDSLFVRQSLPVYIRLLQDAKRTNNYTEADKLLAGIKKFQQKYGAEVYPNKEKIDLEITYNKLQIFMVESASKTRRILNCYTYNIKDNTSTKIILLEKNVKKKTALFSGQNKRQTNFSTFHKYLQLYRKL